MVEVSINQENFVLTLPAVLSDVLPLLGITAPDGIAIAVNTIVIPRPEWGGFVLRDRDDIFVIRATAGG